MSSNLNFIKIRAVVFEKINFECWYAILDQGKGTSTTPCNRNTGVALASAGISVGLASWGQAN